MITVRSLTKKSREGQTQLSQVSFQAGDGEFIALIGASGSGKTTLLRCLSLLERWDKGQYIYNNRDVRFANPFTKLRLKKEWSFLAETPDVDLNKDAIHNVLQSRYQHMNWFRRLTRTVSQHEHMYAMDYLEKVGLLDKGRDKLSKLSGGEKQRVAIAKALIKGARVLFADDPTKGLHPDAQQRVMQDLKAVCTRDNGIVFCALSNLELAERYATRIWGMADGRIVFDIPARRLTKEEREMLFRFHEPSDVGLHNN